MLAAALLTFVLDTARQAFELLLSVGAGTGLIYLLRWFWWRINAWSEISAMVSSFLVALSFFVAGKMGAQVPSHVALLITVATTTVVWVTVTLLTPPTDEATLARFYRQVRPAGPGWRVVRAAAGLGPSPDSIAQQFLAWTTGCVFVYSALFGAGNLLYGRGALGAFFTVVAVASGILLYRLVRAMFQAGGGAADDEITPVPPRAQVPAPHE